MSRGRNVPIIGVDWNHGGYCFGLFPSFAPTGTLNANVSFEQYFASIFLCIMIKEKRQYYTANMIQYDAPFGDPRMEQHHIQEGKV